MSSGSIEGFLSLGQTIAHLCESGKRTRANDLIDNEYIKSRHAI